MDEIVNKLDVDDLTTLMRWMRLSVKKESSMRPPTTRVDFPIVDLKLDGPGIE
jgi:hypothetical protein